MGVKKIILLALVVCAGLSSNGQNGLHFDGVNDYVDCGEILPSGDYTKEAWIRLTTNTGNNIISGDAGHFFWANGGTLKAGHFTPGFTQVASVTPLNTNQWYHVAVSYNATTDSLRIYQDGIIVARGVLDPPATPDPTVLLGTFNGTFFLNADMDDVRIWNDVRTKGEINQFMQCELEGTEDGLVAYYKLNEGTAGGTNTGVSTASDELGSSDGTLLNFDLSGSISNWVEGSDNLGNLTVQTISPSSSTITCGNAVTVDVPNSESDVSYYLIDTENNEVVAGPTAGNGGTLNLDPGTLSSYGTFKVTAALRGGDAMEFNGSTDYFTAIDHPNFDWASSDGTMAVWFKTSTVGTGDQVLATKGGLGASDLRYALIFNGGAVYFDVNDGSTNPRIGGATTGLNDGTWHHVVGTRFGTTLYIYIDGSLEASTDITGLGFLDNTEDFYAGAGTGATNFFEGALDELYLFTSGFSSSDVSDLYTKGLTSDHPDYANFAIGYNFESGLLPEISGTGPDGTTSGTPSTVDGNGKLCSADMTGTASIALDYNTVINEVVTDPQQDWSSTGFTSAPAGTSGSDDEWVEIYVGCTGLDFTGWTIDLTDSDVVTGDLTNTGAFDVSYYVSSGSGSFTSTELGDYLVLGNVNSSQSMNITGLTIELKDADGNTVDEVSIGGGTGEAPSGGASDLFDEAIARIPNGGDTDADDADFKATIATIGADNSPTGTILINELVTDPFTDWSSNDFDGTDGESSVTDLDQWVELYIKSDGLNLTGWTIELNDNSPESGDLTENSTGAFQVVNYISNTTGSSWYNTADGDFVVLGDVRGTSSTSAMNNTGTYLIKDAYGDIIDQVTLGGGNAPNGGSSSFLNESVARIPNGIDTDNDNEDFIQTFPTLGTINVSDTITENRGSMIIFDGNGDYADFGNAEDHGFGSGDFTLELWFKTDVSSGYACLLSKGFTDGNPMYYLLVNGSGGAIATRLLDNSGIGIMQTERGSGFNDNEWHQVALTVDRSSDLAKIYVDGIQQGADIDISSVATGIDPTENLLLGLTNTSVYDLNGSIDEFRIWEKALSQSEIRCQLHLTLDGSEDSIVGYYQFNGSNSTITDAVNGNDGSFGGNAQRTESEVHVGSGVSIKHTVTGIGTISANSTTDDETLDLIFSTAHPNGEIVISYIEENPVGGIPGTRFYNNVGTWIVNNYGTLNTDLDYSVKFNFPDGGVFDVGTAALNSYSLWKRETNATGAWTEETSVASVTSDTPGDNYVQFDGIGSFSMLSITSSISPLPVELLSFDGTPVASGVLLTWTTATETNSDYFELWSSSNGTNFELAATLPAAGNSDEILLYAYEDDITLRGAHYYKLVQVDRDGTKNDYPMVAVQSTEISQLQVTDTGNEFNVFLSGGETLEKVKIYDVSGKLVGMADTENGNSLLHLAKDSLPEGLLIITTLVDGSPISVRVANQ